MLYSPAAISLALVTMSVTFASVMRTLTRLLACLLVRSKGSAINCAALCAQKMAFGESRGSLTEALLLAAANNHCPAVGSQHPAAVDTSDNVIKI